MKNRTVLMVFGAMVIAFFTYIFINTTFDGAMQNLTSKKFYFDLFQSAGMGLVVSWLVLRKSGKKPEKNTAKS